MGAYQVAREVSVPSWPEPSSNLAAGPTISEGRSGRTPDRLACAVPVNVPLLGVIIVPKRNYGQEKRQREVSRRLKQAEKLQRKLDRTNPAAEDADGIESAAPDLPRRGD
jgi:hypothetical protein